MSSIFLWDLDYYEILILIILILVTPAIQLLRKNHSIKEIGFNFDVTTLHNSAFTLIFLLLTIVSVYFLSLLFWGNAYFSTAFQFFGINFLEVIFYIIILAVIEELVFRGIAFRILLDNFGGITALIITSIVFMLAHSLNNYISLVAYINIFFAGILMGLMYIKSRSVYPMIIFHAGWNLILAFVIGSPVSGISYTSYKNTDQNKLSEFMLGGSFGLEEGFLTTILLFIMIFTVIKFFKESPKVLSLEFKRYYS
ncbi:MAG: CPBP family intramembrane metalloprotease [Candidatus Kapabacteria bacterium]|nr:CPBP family intramembrane metalloprotease [Ignavibacteriota bacterium]MCW5885739.1 CPBP family intramembrane metalloprotease [Candidatus Kapabacteria bacterium]